VHKPGSKKRTAKKFNTGTTDLIKRKKRDRRKQGEKGEGEEIAECPELNPNTGIRRKMKWKVPCLTRQLPPFWTIASGAQKRRHESSLRKKTRKV